MKRISTFASALLVLPMLAISATAQVGIKSIPAPDSVKKAFSLRAGSIQDLAVPANTRTNRIVQVELGGRLHTLALLPHKLVACDFKLLVDDGTTIREIPNPIEITYQGTVVGAADSTVAVSLSDGQMHGQVHIGDDTWTIQPLTDEIKTARASQHVVYRYDEVVFPNVSCTAKVVSPYKDTQQVLSGTLQSAEIALDCDYEYYKLNGNDVAKTKAAATTIMNSVDVIYRRDVEICHSITTILVRTAKKYTAGPTVGCCGTGCGLLEEMRTVWAANHANINRDYAHMFTGWGDFSGTIGCAGPPVCGLTGFGVSRTKGNLAGNTGLVAHELGHQWTAGHCSGSDCFIMCAGLGGCGTGLKFGAQSRNSISGYKATRTCLGRCGGCANEASYTYFGKGCAGTGRGIDEGCVVKNWDGTNSRTALTSKTEVAMLANTGGAARQIASVDFFCSAAAAFSLPVHIYGATGGKPGTKLGSSSMSITTSSTVSTATFNPPVAVAANTAFFIAFENAGSPRFNYPATATGADVGWYLRNSSTSSWFDGPTNAWPEKWSYRVNCDTNKAVPMLTATAQPILNGSFGVNLSQARASSLAVLYYTAGTTSLDLAVLGAPGCSAYVDLTTILLIQGAVADGSGSASFPALTIPNDTKFCGAQLHQQILIQDPQANTFGWVLTRRGDPRIGN